MNGRSPGSSRGFLHLGRAELDLQVSLLAEHEITRLVRLVSALAEKSGIQEATDPELDELEQNIAPEKVLERIETEHSEFAREHDRRAVHIQPHERPRCSTGAFALADEFEQRG